MTSVWESLQRLRWVALLLAVCSYALMMHTWYFSIYDDAHPAPTTLRLLLRVLWAVDQWCAIAAILGFAYRFRHQTAPPCVISPLPCFRSMCCIRPSSWSWHIP